MDSTPAKEIDLYLRTGKHDNPVFNGWPGDSVLEACTNGHTALTEALISEVERLSATVVAGVPPTRAIPENFRAFTRHRVEPMVYGLFPKAEHDAVLSVLESSIVCLTRDNIAAALREVVWPSTAWDVANLYLQSIDTELLSKEAPILVGLNDGTTSYVSTRYFNEEELADFVVHESAHVFHNCKRVTAGLPERRKTEWLLDIAFAKRETFAYCCEAYSSLLRMRRAGGKTAELAERIDEWPDAPDESVDPEDYREILREAMSARNGWKRILARCAPKRR